MGEILFLAKYRMSPMLANTHTTVLALPSAVSDRGGAYGADTAT